MAQMAQMAQTDRSLLGRLRPQRTPQKNKRIFLTPDSDFAQYIESLVSNSPLSPNLLSPSFSATHHPLLYPPVPQCSTRNDVIHSCSSRYAPRLSIEWSLQTRRRAHTAVSKSRYTPSRQSPSPVREHPETEPAYLRSGEHVQQMRRVRKVHCRPRHGQCGKLAHSTSTPLFCSTYHCRRQTRVLVKSPRS